MRSRFRAVMISGLVWAAACGQAPGGDTAEAPADTAATAPIPDLSTLVGEIRTGIAELPAMTAADPVAARRTAVDLYATRQETIERHWGPRGDQGPSVELGRAVDAAEQSFHDLMALLNQEAAPDSSGVRRTVTALDLRLEAVLQEAAVQQ